MAPEALAQVLRQLEPLFPTMQHPAVLVGLNAPDDAGVYQLNAERALIATTDFFTPIVDDPYTFGAIAATNAMSDVYAMGGEVLFALNIAAFPESLPAEVIAQILLGGAEQVRRAGSIILGGHTIKNPEPLYGLAVVGEVHPARLFRKTGVQVGVGVKAGSVYRITTQGSLTKALGTGLISTAAKRDQADADDLETAIVSMLTLGRSAMLAGQAASVRCATDITGFGLLGHACEMAERGAGALQLSLDALPLLPGTRRYAEADMAPGGTHSNRSFFSPRVQLQPGISTADELILYDPQTSGGLLLAVPAAQLSTFYTTCAELGQLAWEIGRVVEGHGVQVRK